MGAILSLFTAGAVTSVLQVFTLDEIITFGEISSLLLVRYSKIKIGALKNKKIEEEYRKLELKNKERLTRDIKNVDAAKLFK